MSIRWLSGYRQST